MGVYVYMYPIRNSEKRVHLYWFILNLTAVCVSVTFQPGKNWSWAFSVQKAWRAEPVSSKQPLQSSSRPPHFPAHTMQDLAMGRVRQKLKQQAATSCLLPPLFLALGDMWLFDQLAIMLPHVRGVWTPGRLFIFPAIWLTCWTAAAPTGQAFYQTLEKEVLDVSRIGQRGSRRANKGCVYKVINLIHKEGGTGQEDPFLLSRARSTHACRHCMPETGRGKNLALLDDTTKSWNWGITWWRFAGFGYQ